ncbi:MAG: prepilin-type N-terminal cleavage/methylation domain-containing protein [Vulcanimicrobiota bacterium]
MKKTQGFTMIEIVIAILVVSFILLMVQKILSSGFFYLVKNKDQTRMFRLVQKAVEQERAQVFSTVTTSDSGWNTFDEPDNDFRWRIVKSPATETGFSTLLKENVSIEGPYYPGNSMKKPTFKEYTITTYIARTPFTSRTLKYEPLYTGNKRFWKILHQ